MIKNDYIIPMVDYLRQPVTIIWTFPLYQEINQQRVEANPERWNMNNPWEDGVACSEAKYNSFYYYSLCFSFHCLRELQEYTNRLMGLWRQAEASNRTLLREMSESELCMCPAKDLSAWLIHCSHLHTDTPLFSGSCLNTLRGCGRR